MVRNFLCCNKKKIVSFVVLLVGVVLSLSLYSFNSYDPSWVFYSSKVGGATNVLGPVGANISALLFYFFGMSSFLFLFFVFYISYILFFDTHFTFEVERCLASFVLPFVVAALCNSMHADWFVSIYPGGVFGKGLYLLLASWFDPLGATIFLYAVLSVCIILIFRSTITRLLYSIGVMVHFVTSKQRFLKPAYRFVAKTVYVISYPVIFSITFCKNLFCGIDVTNSDTSIVEFENYILDSEAQASLAQFSQEDQEDIEDLGVDTDKVAQKSLWSEPLQEVKKTKKKKPAYRLPGNDLFAFTDFESGKKDQYSELEKRAKILEEKLERFGVFGKVVSIKRGPVITLFEYQPQADSKISKILALEDDLALALQALSIRIIAPIPGRSVVGFEVANKNRHDVFFSSIVKSKAFKDFSGSIPLVIGKDTVGNDVIVDLATMPHLLIAGSTGSGKSVALNSLLISMLCKLTPEQLNLVLVDPKRLEFSAYEDIGHLLFPIITDPKKVSPVLKWVVHNMEDRYEKMAQVGARNIFDYNKKVPEGLPFTVIVIDELADLMMVSGKDIEGLIARIAQMARAAGIHMIVATQRPSVDVITGLIKVNFPSRMSFRVTSKVDSRTILDCCGAEKLLGRGDMLFLGSGSSSLRRLHGSYVSSQEIDKVVNHIRAERAPRYRDLTEYIQVEESGLSDADDVLYKDVLEFLDSIDEVSISLLQRKFRIGYNRSARIIEMLEAQGVILPSEGGKTRKVVR